MGTPARGKKFTPAQGHWPRAGVNFWPRVGVPNSFLRAGQGSAFLVISGAGAGGELGGVQQWVLLNRHIYCHPHLHDPAQQGQDCRRLGVQFKVSIARK
jgi:hypothetical protein